MRHLIFFLISFLSINAQAQDAKTIRTIYDLALTQSEAYENLRVLCKDCLLYTSDAADDC